MAKMGSSGQSFIRRHKATLQTIALIVILGLPFVLYVFAQAGQAVLVTALLALMALVMVVIVIIT
jgi:hypothetical protein